LARAGRLPEAAYNIFADDKVLGLEQERLGGLDPAVGMEPARHGRGVEHIVECQKCHALMVGHVVLDDDTVATFQGILTNPQFQLVVQALAQKKSADILSAPKVTTISGHQAQIRVAQEFIYPTTYTPVLSTATPYA
jgi:Flp pilus assembly secretin CpaC